MRLEVSFSTGFELNESLSMLSSSEKAKRPIMVGIWGAPFSIHGVPK
jgi:hypothetical protein